MIYRGLYIMGNLAAADSFHTRLDTLMKEGYYYRNGIDDL